MVESQLNCNLKANQEYFMYGSIYDDSLHLFLHYLKGLCDHTGDGSNHFFDREKVIVINAPQEPSGQLTFRVCETTVYKEWPPVVRSLGKTEIGDDSQLTAIRSSIDVRVGPDPVKFFTELGFEEAFYYTTQGYLFFKGKIKVKVYKVFKAIREESTVKGRRRKPITGSYLVEVSCIGPAGRPDIAVEVRKLADLMRPMVNMMKIDPDQLPPHTFRLQAHRQLVNKES